MALASPRTTIAGILAVVECSREAFGGRTPINLPALTVSVGQMIEALREVAGQEVVSRISHEPDENIARIVGGWPARFDCKRTKALGLKPDASYQDIIRQFIDMNRSA